MSWKGQSSIELGCNSSGSERRVILWKKDGHKTHEVCFEEMDWASDGIRTKKQAQKIIEFLEKAKEFLK